MRLRLWLIVLLAPLLGACEVNINPVSVNDHARGGGRPGPHSGQPPVPEEQSIAYPVSETESYARVFWYGQYCLQTTFYIRMSDGTSRVRYSTPHSCSWRPHSQSHAPMPTKAVGTSTKPPPRPVREAGHPIS